MIEQITPASVRITALEERRIAKKGERQASPSTHVAVYTSSHVFHTLYGFLFSSKGILFYPTHGHLTKARIKKIIKKRLSMITYFIK